MQSRYAKWGGHFLKETLKRGVDEERRVWGGGKRKQSNDDSNKTQEAGRQLTEKQQSWKRLKWTLDSNSVCAAAQVVLSRLSETFERTRRHRARQRETGRQSDSRTKAALCCSNFKNVASISKLFACNFNMNQARESSHASSSSKHKGGGEGGWGIRAGVGAAVRGGVVVSPSKAVRQLDCEYESCMQICQNDYFSFCNCLASKRERQGERGRGRGRGIAGYLGLARGVGSASTFPLI